MPLLVGFGFPGGADFLQIDVAALGEVHDYAGAVDAFAGQGGVYLNGEFGSWRRSDEMGGCTEEQGRQEKLAHG